MRIMKEQMCLKTLKRNIVPGNFHETIPDLELDSDNKGQINEGHKDSLKESIPLEKAQ